MIETPEVTVFPLPGKVGHALTLLTDGEHLAHALPPAGGWRASGACLLESLLPQVRALALLLASRRWRQEAATPSRLADAADWLAARIVLLELTRVEVDEAGRALLMQANTRLVALSEELGLELPLAAPLLKRGGLSGGRLRAWSQREWPQTDGTLAGAIAASRQAAEHCRQPWLALLSLML